MKKRNLVFKMVMVIVIAMCIIMPNFSMAATSGLTWDEIDQQAKGFLNTGSNQQGVSQEKIQNIVIPIAQMLVAIGDVVIAIVIGVMAIKYMISSPEDKAKLKTQLIGVTISACVIFGAQFIWATAYEFFSNLAR